jgi:N6-adenosine-specific RNA methylase IME4
VEEVMAEMADPMIEPFTGLMRGKYRIVLADPPWASMHLDTIRTLPVAALCLPDCTCIIRATGPTLRDAAGTLVRWGFSYRSLGAVADGGGLWLIGIRGAPKENFHPESFYLDRRTLTRANDAVRPDNAARAADAMRADCEALWDGPRIVLFAGEWMVGWDIWPPLEPHGDRHLIYSE